MFQPTSHSYLKHAYHEIFYLKKKTELKKKVILS